MSGFYVCPSCDQEVKVGSRGCPHCLKRQKKKKKAPKKERRKPWESDEIYDGLDLPDGDFNYDEFCAKEFGTDAPHKQIGIKRYWWIWALIFLLLAIYFFVKTGRFWWE